MRCSCVHTEPRHQINASTDAAPPSASQGHGHERRSLLYKYSPGHSAWSQRYYDLEEFENLTEQQRRILAPPSVGRRPNVIQEATAT